MDLEQVTYYPFRPGYASTIQKYQGAELPHVCLEQPTQALAEWPSWIGSCGWSAKHRPLPARGPIITSRSRDSSVAEFEKEQGPSTCFDTVQEHMHGQTPEERHKKGLVSKCVNRSDCQKFKLRYSSCLKQNVQPGGGCVALGRRLLGGGCVGVVALGGRLCCPQ
eukprot:2045432-Amphidinium_carterae.1